MRARSFICSSVCILIVLAGCAPKREPAGSSLPEPKARQVAQAVAFMVGGGSVYDVADTGSMEPTLDGRSFVVTERCRVEDLHVGDIVVRAMPIGNVVHRVWAVAPVRTLGDANDSADAGAVDQAGLRGRVVCVVYGSGEKFAGNSGAVDCRK